ncbi:MAG: sigma-54 dependent transcriptional regulator [bacterium]
MPEPAHKVLVVDDEENMRFFLREALSRENYEVALAASGEEALRLLRADGFGAVILDIRMSRIGGMEVLEEIKKEKPELPVIMMTAYGSKKVAMETLRKGAYDYFTKPFDVDEMRVVVKRAVEKQKLEEEIKLLRKRLSERYSFDGVVGNSKEMRDVLELVSKVINNDVTVILYGESGTGKELIATLIHRNSPRRDAPLVKINCAAIPETLLESELFGHEKGAFTGAGAMKEGKFEVANGGTLFLDEIGDMSMVTQSKLLRVLEEKKFERLGGTGVIEVDIRIIAATNKDLPRLIQEGRFREDLYFRLNVVPIFLPPLRARKTDIPLLVEHFLDQAHKRFGVERKGLSQGAMRLLMDYDWPGNVRELENVMQRAVVTSRGEVIDEGISLPVMLHGADRGMRTVANPAAKGWDHSLPEIVESLTEAAEKRLITEALAKTNWSRTRTAELLKICRKSLHNKMKKYGIGEP